MSPKAPATVPDGGHSDSGTLTASREERKFLVAREKLDALTRAFDQHLRHHRFTGPGANQLSLPQHFVTTIYFDTAARLHFHQARQGADADIKMRAKEYYDLHPSLAELATDPAQIGAYQDWLWFEMKTRSGTNTAKRRVRIEKRLFASLFSEAQMSANRLAEAGPATRDPDPERAATLAAIANYCRTLPSPLRADALVNYRRASWQDEPGALRVTVDTDLGAFPVPPDLWTRRAPLVRAALGPARRSEPRAILEVKSLAPWPAWLFEAVARTGAVEERFSKFLWASEALHGAG